MSESTPLTTQRVLCQRVLCQSTSLTTQRVLCQRVLGSPLRECSTIYQRVLPSPLRVQYIREYFPHLSECSTSESTSLTSQRVVDPEAVLHVPGEQGADQATDVAEAWAWSEAWAHSGVGQQEGS